MAYDFTEPHTLPEAVNKLSARTPIGSVLRTAEWARVPRELRERAFFSAGVTSAQWLQAAQDKLIALASNARSVNERGESYWAQNRQKIVKELHQLGTDLGINKDVLPEHQGTLRDPLSKVRLNLIVNTQMEMAYGYSDWKTGTQDPDLLNEFPAWELIRVKARRVPRNWDARWVAAGGSGGRKVALKTSPIWRKLNRFGNPWPPFDFNSGMGVEEKDREQAEAMGLISPKEKLSPDHEEFNHGLSQTVPNLQPETQKWLKSFFGDQIKITGETAEWTGKGAAPKTPPTPEPEDKPTKVKKKVKVKEEPKPEPEPKAEPEPKQEPKAETPKEKPVEAGTPNAGTTKEAKPKAEPIKMAKRDPVSEKWFNGKATVMDGKQAVTGVEAKKYIALTGAPDGAEVTLGKATLSKQGNISRPVTVQHPLFISQQRVIRETKKEIYNSVFMLSKKAPKRFGLRVFATQAKEAAALGYKKIKCYAVRGGAFNGWYTWPRFGYDAPLDHHTMRGYGITLPPSLAHAKSVLDLMETQEGRDWWKTNGFGMDMEFDLSENSRSFQVLNDYLSESDVTL